MPADRTRARNVFIYFSTEPDVKGGLRAARKMKERELLDMLDVTFHAPGGFDVKFDRETNFISGGNRQLRHGRYTLHPRVQGEQISVSNAQYHPRTLSMSDSGRDDGFRRQVRQRDGRCVITNLINHDPEDEGGWFRFQAAHIFPLSLSAIFSRLGYGNLTTINSPQNGILLRNDIHSSWDNYAIAVNPRTYRVQAFAPSTWDLHGKLLQDVCRRPNDNRAVLDALLSWHFEQAVLCNMRGAGEPIYEFDFPPGSDMMGTILQEPQAAERMEAELFGRLHGVA